MSDLRIAPLTLAPAKIAGPEAKEGTRSGEANFGQWLQKSLEQVDQMQQDSDTAARKLVSGENKDIHGTMIAMQKASITLDLMMEVRNKIISAYDEIKRMQF